MNILDTTLFGLTAWRVCVAAALVLFYIGLRIHWARTAARETGYAKTQPMTAMASAAANKSDVGLSDTQRIDQLRRTLTLTAGEQADLKDLTFGNLSRLQVRFVGIEQVSGRELAHVKLDLGGVTADCGSSVQQVGENDFLVPRALPGDQHATIHYMCGKAEAVSFLRVSVPKFNVDAETASVEVLHVRGRRAA